MQQKLLKLLRAFLPLLLWNFCSRTPVSRYPNRWTHLPRNVTDKSAEHPYCYCVGFHRSVQALHYYVPPSEMDLSFSPCVLLRTNVSFLTLLIFTDSSVDGSNWCCWLKINFPLSPPHVLCSFQLDPYKICVAIAKFWSSLTWTGK